MASLAIYYAIYAMLIMIPIVMALSAFGGVALGASRPYWLVVAYWLVIFYFPNASFGLAFKNVTMSENVYARGTGLLVLPILNWILIGMTVVCGTSVYFNVVAKVRTNIRPFIAAFWILFVIHMVYGLATDHKFSELLTSKGLFNILNFLMAFFIVTAFVKDADDARRFINIILFAAVTRGIYGVIRYFAWGGDPANAYANIEKIDIKLTFFDINDVFMATVGAFIAGWRVMEMRHERMSWRKLMYLAILAIETFVVLFSFRRTGWAGFAFVAILFAMAYDGTTRRKLFALYAAIGIPALLALAGKRMAESYRNADANILERLAPDIFMTAHRTTELPSRWLEWSAAWDAITTSPIVGLGIMGEYNGHGYLALAFHFGDFTWLHSGFLHLMLKSGVIGLFWLLGMWFYFLKFVREHNREVSPTARMLMLIGVAGLLFYLPTWLLGNPILEYRTMQLQGLTLALPYLAYALSGRAARA